MRQVIVAVAAWFGMGMLAASAVAQTAGMMSFQGLIRDSGGNAVVGPVTLQLQIVDGANTVLDASGDGAVGAEDTFTVNTTAVEGIVSIKYGPIAPSVFSGSQRFLKVTVTSPALPALAPIEMVSPPAIAEQLNARGTGNPAVVTSTDGRVGVGDVDVAALGQKLSVQSVSTFGSGISLHSREVGGRNWSVLSSGSGNTGGQGNLQFLLDSTPRMTIAPSGNVGIGTTGPIDLLTLVSSTADPRVGLANTAPGGNYWFIGSTANASGVTPGGLRFHRYNGGDMMFIAADGLVGIGTTAPVARLHVAGESRLAGKVRVEGNLGVGTADPGFPLSVVGPDADLRIQLRNNGAAGRDWQLISTNSSSGVGAGYFRIYDNSAVLDRLVISPAGNVGIGILSPQVKLDVAGDINALARTLSTGAIELSNPGLPLVDFHYQGDLADYNARLLNAADRILEVDFKPGATGTLQVNGNIRYTGNIADNSDARFKTNVVGLQEALSTVRQLRPVRFDWRCSEFPDRGFSSAPQIGFIAQEVEPLVPEVVHKGTDGYYAVDYSHITPLLTAAIQELHRLVESGSATIAEQQQQIERQRQQLDQQQAQIADLLARMDRLERVTRRLGVDPIEPNALPATNDEAKQPHYARPLGGN